MDIEKLKNTNLEYKNKINIPDIQFGIEIEFASASFIDVKENLKKILEYDPVKIALDDKTNEIKDRYKKWSLKNDGTVQTYKEEYPHIRLGGEINTPIMKNQKKCWQELKLICEILKETKNIKMDGNCSIHIHTSQTIYNTLQEYKNLLKLIMIYEDIAYKIGYGETNKIRNLLTKFAKSMSYIIYEKLYDIENAETEKEIVSILKYDRKTSFNIRNIINPNKPTIENRTGNPTLNEKIIQNYVLFNMNFLNYAKEENFDTEFINYKIKHYEPLFLCESLKDKPEKAQELLDRIIKNEEDQIYLLKQYLKIYNENDIEKTFHL